MARLIATSALDGRAPFETGQAWLSEVSVAPATAIAPFHGQEDAVRAALEQGLGLGFPAPGQVLEGAVARIVWAGRGQAFVLGCAAPDLTGLAAVTDLSDGWVALRLHGMGAASVLARLVPVDLRDSAFPPGKAARTQLGHMLALILRRAEGFEILVMRSFAQSAWHEIETAMKGLAARG